MAKWKSKGRDVLGRGIARRKYERRAPVNMIRMEERLNQALINAGYEPLHAGDHISVGMASSYRLSRFRNRRK